MGDKFEYRYSAPTSEQRKEIDSIRNQYLPKDKSMSKLDRLRHLDSKVKEIPLIWALSLGIVGILLFGTGMTFYLEWTKYWYIGIPFSLVGVLNMIIAYPVFKRMTNRLKNKYGEEIIKLSNELLNEEDQK